MHRFRFLPARYRIAAMALLFGMMEWGLFELLRMPYRPPVDMSTFLGTEKYGVILYMAFMLVLAAGLFTRQVRRSRLSSEDRIWLCSVLAFFAAVVVFVALDPPWPVTPLRRILY